MVRLEEVGAAHRLDGAARIQSGTCPKRAGGNMAAGVQQIGFNPRRNQ